MKVLDNPFWNFFDFLMVVSLAHILLCCFIEIIATNAHTYYIYRLALVFLMNCLSLLNLFFFPLFLLRFSVHSLKMNKLIWIDSMLRFRLLLYWSVWFIHNIIKLTEFFPQLFIALVNRKCNSFNFLHSKLQITDNFVQFLYFLLMNQLNLS